MDYVIIVNDNGELKTITAAEIVEQSGREAQDGAYDGPLIEDHFEAAINTILDRRSATEQMAKMLDRVVMHTGQYRSISDNTLETYVIFEDGGELRGKAANDFIAAQREDIKKSAR